ARNSSRRRRRECDCTAHGPRARGNPITHPLSGGVAMRTLFAIAACALGLVLPARADDKPLDKSAPLERAELDKRAARVAYEAAVTGTEIFNKGDHAGCFRLYQGTLQALMPMLDHRPQLATSVAEKLAKAKTMRPADGAFVLREALDAIIGKPKPTKSLWDRL